MKQFATYFTHGVRNGARLRGEIYHAQAAEQILDIVDAFFFAGTGVSGGVIRKKVELITDGACVGNPGPGGWACVLIFGKHRKELFGCEKHTTNNRMEIQAAVEGLKALTEACQVTITTDSQYLKKGITGWIYKWKRNGWKTSSGDPVVNQDLWNELDAQVQRHQATWEWTKGHAAHEDNNRCDELATRAAREQISKS